VLAFYQESGLPEGKKGKRIQDFIEILSTEDILKI
jgi:hypothetical protein